jgi:hypothetical protein
MLIRHSEPNKYDQAPYGTQLCVKLTDDELEYYIQLSNDEENPRWEKFDTLPQKIGPVDTAP